jgi:hypothetical protein
MGQAEARGTSADSSTSDRGRRGIAFLRLGLGLAWIANAVYILDPSNDFFASFSGVAASFGGSTAGGPALANFVSAYAMVFSIGIAAITVSLAISFLSDVAVRAACLLGAGFNVALLVSQWGQISTLPGGTDIGPQPLYLIGYAALWVGYRPGELSVSSLARSWLSRRRLGRPVPVGSVGGV